MRLAAVCAIYGGYDLIPPVPDGVDDAVLVTDVPVRSGWRNVVEPSTSDPRLAAKRPKMRPDLYTDADASLWMDGSIHVLDHRFLQVVRERLANYEILLWEHPEDRDCLVDEAQHCANWGKWPTEPLLEQAHHYLKEGMPRHFGLWANGCIARLHTQRMADLGDQWLSEVSRWSTRDQVSLPYLLWRLGVQPGTFGADQLNNDMVSIVPHAKEIHDYRRTVLSLESRIIHLDDQLRWAEWNLDQERSAHQRLRTRRIVRIALMLARGLRPMLQAVRRARSRAQGHSSTT